MKEHHSLDHETQRNLLGEHDAKLIHVETTNDKGISEVYISTPRYALIIASYLWYKIDPSDHGWARQHVFAMWVNEAICRITSHNSSLNVATHITLHAIALGNVKPYEEDAVNNLVKNTRAEHQYELTRN